MKFRAFLTASLSIILVLAILFTSLPSYSVSADEGEGSGQDRANTGYENWYYYIGDLVNAANGNLYFSSPDISLKARGLNIELTRAYNSLNSCVDSPFGFGWTHNYNVRLVEDDDVTLYEADGSRHIYTNLGDGVYDSPSGINSVLMKNDDDTFTLCLKDGSRKEFSADGILQKIVDKNGNSLTLSYTDGNLTEVRDDSGLSLVFNYSGNHISSIEDPLGRKIQYQYSGGNLSKVTDAMQKHTIYYYNTGHYLRSIVNRAGVMINFRYQNDQVVEISSSLYDRTTGLPQKLVKIYSIEYGTNVTSFINALGGKTIVQLDESGSPTLVVDPLNQTTLTSWDAQRNRTGYRDAAGNTYSYTYDEYGNLTKEEAPLSRITEWEWDTGFLTENPPVYISLLKSATDANHNTTSYTYDEYGNQTAITNALGKKTIYTYDEYGYVTSYTDCNGNTTNFDYDNHGNRTRATYPLDNENTASIITAYDPAGRLLSRTDGNGGITSYLYDNNDLLIKETDPLGGIKSYTYNEEGSLLKMVDQAGNTTEYRRTLGGRIDAVTDAAGNTASYVYDAAGNMLSQTEPDGTISTMTYDLLGRITSLTDAMGHTEYYSYDPNGNQVFRQDKRGNITRYIYDSLNRLTAEIDSLNNATTYEYDAVGNKTKVTDARNNKTVYEYDALNRLTKVIDALKNETNYVYDDNGNLLEEKDARGNITSYTYNPLNQVLTRTNALGQVYKYTYDAVGNVISETDPAGNVTQFEYDSLNRLVKTINPLQAVSSNEYDFLGNILKKTDPNGNEFSYKYDALGRLIEETDPLGRITHFEYDALGNLLKQTDAEGNAVIYSYDKLGRLVSQTDAEGQETFFKYDEVGNLTEVTDANSGKTLYVYDSLNRLVSTTTPMNKTVVCTYDEVGNMISRTDANGDKTEFAYDALNRLTRVEYPNGDVVTYTFDAAGNRLVITNTGGIADITTNTYDELNRILSTTVNYGDLFTKTISYTYNDIGKRATMTDPDNRKTTYTYDKAGNLTELTSPDGVTSYSYDPAGRRTGAVLANGTIVAYTYDAAGQLTGMVNSSGQNIISSQTYTYDNAGNRLTMTDAEKNTFKYEYDKVYRLISVTSPQNVVTSYTYDKMGNRLTKSRQEMGEDYSFDSGNRLTSAGLINYSYDDNGNLTQKIDDEEVTNYTYDYENRLTGAVMEDTFQVSYAYAPYGDRLQRVEDGESTYFFYDIADILLEMDEEGNTIARYTHGPWIDEPLIEERSSVLSFYHLNDQGSVVAVTDGDGEIVNTFNYDVFGRILNNPGSISDQYLFAGRQYDSTTGLYFMRARYYDPETGRFITSDPWGQSLSELNSYTYAKNNPVNLTDPFGGRAFIRFSGKTYYLDEYDRACLERAQKAYEDAFNNFSNEVFRIKNELNNKLNQLRQMEQQKCDRAVMHAVISTFVGVVVGTVVGAVTLNPLAGAVAGTLACTAYNACVNGSLNWTDAGQGVVGTLTSLSTVFVGSLGATFNLWWSTRDAEGSLKTELEKINKLALEWQKAFNKYIKDSEAQLPAVFHEYADKNCKTRKTPPVSTPPLSTGKRPVRKPLSGGLTETGTGSEYEDLEVRSKAFVDPETQEETVDITTSVTVTNRGTRETKEGDYSIETSLYSSPTTGGDEGRKVLLVADESNEAYKEYQAALDYLGENYDTVLVDSQYSPVYEDQDPSTRDLKDYDVVIWECSSDTQGVLENSTQTELQKYLDNHGCLGVFGRGILVRWPQNYGTLMSDYMYVNGKGNLYTSEIVNGVPKTLGEGLSFSLSGYSDCTGVASVKSGGEACFLASNQIAAVQADSGSYKTVFFSFTLEQLATDNEQNDLMQAVTQFLDCRYRHPGGGGDEEDPPPVRAPPLKPGETTRIPVTVTVTPGPHKAVFTLSPKDGNGSNNTSTTKLYAKKTTTPPSENKYTFDDPVTGNPVESGFKSEDHSPYSTTRTSYLPEYRQAPGNTTDAWWCGLSPTESYDYVSGNTFVNPGGYGNNWDDSLLFPDVPVDANSTSTNVNFSLYYNTQAGSDYVHFEIWNFLTNQWDNYGSWSGDAHQWGTQTKWIGNCHYSNAVNQRSFRSASDAFIRFRFHFVSDGQGSNQDGGYNSIGAFGVDNLEVKKIDNTIIYKNTGGDGNEIGDAPKGMGYSIGSYWHLVKYKGSYQWAAFNEQTMKWTYQMSDYLVMPVTDISAMEHPVLYYDAEFDLPDSSWDTLLIKASLDGGKTWENQDLYKLGGNGGQQTVHPIDLTNYKSAQFTVAFVADAWGDTHTWGVYLDNIEIREAGQGGGGNEPEIVLQPPVADFTPGTPSAKVNQAVTFNASASSDPDGTITSYEWDFGDGETGTGISITHTYTSPWIYPVILKVTDNDNLTDTTWYELPVSFQSNPPNTTVPTYTPATTTPKPVEKPGSTVVSDKVDSRGVFKEDVPCQSEDKKIVLNIPEGTLGKTADGQPLTVITIEPMETTPPPPPNASIVALVYDFGPDGATFDPPVELIMSYDPAALPEGASEQNLVVAYFDTAANIWVELPTVVDPLTRKLIVKVTHFTAFTVLSKRSPEPTTTVPVISPTPTAAPSGPPETSPAVSPSTTPAPSTQPSSSIPVVTSSPAETQPTGPMPEQTSPVNWTILIIVLIVVLAAVIGITVIRRRKS